MRKVICGVLLSVFAFSAFARPMIGIAAATLADKKNEARFSFEFLQAKGRYDDAGNYADFAAGEARENYQLTMNFNYGAAKNSEIDLFVPYIVRSFTKTNGDKPACSAVGDIWLIGKNKLNEVGNGKGVFSACAGVKFPNAKSIFSDAKNTLPPGSGTWDVVGGFSSKEDRPPFIIYGNIFYVYRFPMNASNFAGSAISDVNPAATEVKFTPGAMLKYDVGVEYPVGKFLSLMVEYNGSTQYESKAEYLGAGTDATAALSALDTTEYTFSKSVLGKASAGVLLTLSENFTISAGAGMPVAANNAFGGMTYFANLSLII